LAVHGLSRAFLSDKPAFHEVADEWLHFIGEAPIVMHNASFDVGFLNAELQRVQRPPLAPERVVDTLLLARRRHPAGPNSLDALCKRYGIDNSRRTRHGALLDSFLLAQVYVELLGERQATLGLGDGADGEVVLTPRAATAKPRPEPLAPRLSLEAERAHAEFVKSLGANPLWLRYAEESQAAS
jgi:DNA polymerase-3 subunit epsilon